MQTWFAPIVGGFFVFVTSTLWESSGAIGAAVAAAIGVTVGQICLYYLGGTKK
jgi:hypothetical protein